MKIPKVFIPDKDLEDKIRELVKRPKNQTSKDIPAGYNKRDCKIIYNRAKEVVEKLGKLDSSSSVYSFEDQKTGIIIEYDPRWIKNQTTHLNILTKNCSPTVIKYNIVFESAQHNISKQQEISLYVPGGWQDRLERLYQKAQKI